MKYILSKDYFQQTGSWCPYGFGKDWARLTCPPSRPIITPTYGGLTGLAEQAGSLCLQASVHPVYLKTLSVSKFDMSNVLDPPYHVHDSLPQKSYHLAPTKCTNMQWHQNNPVPFPPLVNFTPPIRSKIISHCYKDPNFLYHVLNVSKCS